MLYGLCVSLLIYLSIFTGFQQSQQYTNQEMIPEINVYIDRVSDITVTKAEAFMDALEVKLTAANLKVKFISTPSLNQNHSANSIGSIRFDPVFDGERIIQGYTVAILVAPPELKAISPILESKISISISVDAPFAHDAVYAMVSAALNQCDIAIPFFQELKKSESSQVDNLNYTLATCYLLEGNYQSSIDLYKQQLFTNEGSFLGTNLAWLYLQTGEKTEAFITMDLAIKNYMYFDRDSSKLFAARAQLYNLAFRYDDAIADLNTAVELSPADPALYILRGQTYLLLYEWDAVLADYNKALELDPTYADAYYFRGVLYYSILQTGQDMYTAALADFQHYLELAPDGEHAAEAARSATDIQTQIDALNN